jgi:tRNA threonylcarbamoyladenosine biosynthesis protein TsaE
MEHCFFIDSEDFITLDAIASKIMIQYPGKNTFSLQGELGVGKTTFIKSFCKHLGVIDSLSSPTFSLINRYRTKDQGIVFHLDMYRIKTIDEALEAGIEEALYSDNYCFIEWPEIIASILPENFVSLKLLLNTKTFQRTIKVR